MSKESTGINTKDFMIGTLIGGIIGATTALFLAPKSGRELRGNISTQASTVAEKTNKLTSGALEKGGEWANIAKDKTSSLTQTVTEQSSQLMNKVRDIRKTNDSSDSVNDEISAVDELAEEARNSENSSLQAQEEVISSQADQTSEEKKQTVPETSNQS